jgi:two-component system CheB/CheR fusion protein
MPVSDQHLELILEKLRIARNVDFRNYKRATLRRRIERRVADRRCQDVDEYIALLDREPLELDSLLAAMFIKATRFFRDDEVWHLLKTRILPDLIAARRLKQVLRIWCAGCATGEEVFSVAILVADALGTDIGSWDVKIFGTDVDEGALAYARRATYSPQQVESVPKDTLKRWFFPAPEGFAIRKELRRVVVFGVNNLVSDAPISRLDLVFCRNVFIYLDNELQKRAISRFHYALRRDGVLVLGRSELIPFAAQLFQPIDLPRRIYRRDGDRKDFGLGAQVFTQMNDHDIPNRPADSPGDDPFAPGQICKDILDALPVPIIGTGVDGDVRYWSPEAARVWGRSSREVMGKKLWALGLSGLIGDLLVEKTNAVREGRAERETTDGVIAVPGRLEPMVVSVELSPLHNNTTKQVVGLLYAVHDVTGLRALEREMRHVNSELKISNERLQVANEELQAANEELETTNEELQSANEELQTTNEELQSANEELETTNEELQSTNVELDATNRELAYRTDELNLLGFYQRTIIRSLSAAVIVLNSDGRITHWNIAAERLLGLAEAEALGQTFWTLRIPALRRNVTIRIRKALREDRAFRDAEMAYDLPTGGRGLANVAALPLLEGKNSMGAVIIFEDMTRFVKAAERRVREKLKGAPSGEAPAARSKGKGKAADGDRSKEDGAGEAKGKAKAKAKAKAKVRASALPVSRKAAVGSKRALAQGVANGSPSGVQGDPSGAGEKASS